MENEKKAKEILNCKNCRIQLKAGGVKCPPECTNFKDLMQMAEYKDEQYNNLIKQANENSIKQFELGCGKESERLIRKAVEWLKEQKEMIGISFEEDFLERFKQAMKGE